MVHTTGLEKGVLVILVEMSARTNKTRIPRAAKTQERHTAIHVTLMCFPTITRQLHSK